MNKPIMYIILRNTDPAYKERKQREAEKKALLKDPDYRTATGYFNEIDYRAVTEEQKQATIYKYIRNLDENERVKEILKDYYEHTKEIFS